MKKSGHRKLLCEFSNSSKLNALLALNAILVYKFRPERTGFNMYAECMQLQLAFLAL